MAHSDAATTPVGRRDVQDNRQSECRDSARQNCMSEVMDTFISQHARTGQQSFTDSEHGDSTAKPERSDIAAGLYDPNVPLSHFDTVAPGVFRSGAPNGEAGLKEAVDKIWGDSQFNPDDAKKTTIIDLRGFATGKNSQATADAVKEEDAEAKALGIDHISIPMYSNEKASPQEIQSTLDLIDQKLAAGQNVLIHCHHGTDRTGTIAAAYQLTHDPQLQQLLRDNPDQAYKIGLQSMKDNGFDPSATPALAQSFFDYVTWKHDQLTQPAGAK
jgi:protein-tyrosine phosphatase